MKEDFKSTQILHLALALGSLLFFIIVNILNDFKYKEEFDSSDSFLIYIVIAFVPLSIFMSRLMNKQALSFLNKESDLKEKAKNYRSRVIIRSALIEGAILFAAVVVLLTGHLYPAIAFVAGWFFLLWSRPTKEEFAQDYHLSSQERHDLINR